MQPSPPASPTAALTSMLSVRAWRAADAALHPAHTRYDRERMLTALLRLWPTQLSGEEPAKTRSILTSLRRALRRERSLARLNHVRYDISRHIALIQAWRAESDRLRQLLTSGGDALSKAEAPQ